MCGVHVMCFWSWVDSLYLDYENARVFNVLGPRPLSYRQKPVRLPFCKSGKLINNSQIIAMQVDGQLKQIT